MPIYEFYCEACNTIFNFFSKTITSKLPACPRCNGVLRRQVSLFSCIDSLNKETGLEDFPIDENKLDKAMTSLTTETERLNEEDPRQAADLMRKFSEMTGVKLGAGMQEVLRRLESGEDPEKIEADMGDVLDSEEPFLPPQAKEVSGGAKETKPLRDETLYEF